MCDPRVTSAARGSLLSRLEQLLERRPWPSVLVALALLLIAALSAATDVRAGDEDCFAIEVTSYSPTGIAGCTLDGPTDGIASWYPGDIAAANWCTWPWTDCGSVRVQSHATGVAITVPVGMFGDLYTTTPDERLVDLTLGQVLALGLDPADGTFGVTVTPIDQAGSPRLESAAGTVSLGGAVPAVLPDTAVAP